MKKNTEFNLNLPKYDEEKNNELLPIYSKTKDVAILNELTLNNLRLISPFAYYYYKRYNLSYEDLFYEGIPGLIEGIKKFDCKVGSKLSTFVGFYIRNSIKKYIELNYKPVKYPIRLIRETKKVEAKIEELGENISNEELAAALGYSIERVILCRQLISNSISLDEVTRLNDDEDTSIELLKNTIVDEKVSPEQIALYNSQRKQLLFYLKRVLTKKQLSVLILRFGFLTVPMVDEKIAKVFGVSRAAIYDRWKNSQETLANDLTFCEFCGISREEIKYEKRK